jgi:Xaa-Pro aminopeptidase
MDVNQYQHILSGKDAGTGVALPKSEYDRRIERVRQSMLSQGLDALLVTDISNLFYLTGYYTFGSGNHACLILPSEGEPTLHVADLEIPSAVVNSWVTDIRTSVWQQQFRTGAGEDLADIVRQCGLESKRLGVETGRRGLLASVYLALRANLPNAALVDTSMLIDEITYLKSDLEIDCLRKAAAYTAAGVDASYAAARAGATDNDVAKAGYEGMVAAGSEFMSVQPIVTSGVRTSYPHQTYRRQTIETNDVVFLEYGGCHHRYTAPLMRTIVTGKPTDHMLRIADATEATLAVMLEALRPGRAFRDIISDARKAHRSVDDEVYFFGSYGYGLGAGFPPTWGGSLHISDGIDLVLLPGMALHVPMNFTVPGKFGIAFSESVIITADGCELLVEHPRQLYYS